MEEKNTIIQPTFRINDTIEISFADADRFAKILKETPDLSKLPYSSDQLASARIFFFDYLLFLKLEGLANKKLAHISVSLTITKAIKELGLNLHDIVHLIQRPPSDSVNQKTGALYSFFKSFYLKIP